MSRYEHGTSYYIKHTRDTVSHRASPTRISSEDKAQGMSIYDLKTEVSGKQEALHLAGVRRDSSRIQIQDALFKMIDLNTLATFKKVFSPSLCYLFCYYKRSY